MSASRSRRRLAHAATCVASALALVVAVGVTAPATASPTAFPSALFGTGTTARVIVLADSVEQAARAVDAAGGDVYIELAIVNGVGAEVPVAALPTLNSAAGVRGVTPDAKMHVQGSVTDERSVGKPKSVYPKVVRSDKLNEQGGDGDGITVAVLDTGINATADLSGRILNVRSRLLAPLRSCVNFSGESSCADSYGHGTFMAGIIAGDGSASKGKYVGAAPEADLVSIKVAGRDGSADITTVIAGIEWAVIFKDDYDIRVLNLSLGTNSKQSWKVDPLNYAVEQAWFAGITVVVAASNRGPDPGTISKPGDDPWVITVGATDDVMTVALGDDLLPDFSSRGPAPLGVAKPDVVAPGGHIVSLRAVGSAIDDEFPHYIDKTYRRGSGTSMSAAVVSGVAAAILSKKPTTTPDRLKHILVETARPVAVDDPDAVGSGVVDAYAATFNAPNGLANEGLGESSGKGSFDASRNDLLVTVDGQVLRGLQNAQKLLFDLGFLLNLDLWTKLIWTVTQLLGIWHVTSWYGQTWEGHNWEGCTWDDEHSEKCFYGHNWEGSTWYGAWD